MFIYGNKYLIMKKNRVFDVHRINNYSRFWCLCYVVYEIKQNVYGLLINITLIEFEVECIFIIFIFFFRFGVLCKLLSPTIFFINQIIIFFPLELAKSSLNNNVFFFFWKGVIKTRVYLHTYHVLVTDYASVVELL